MVKSMLYELNRRGFSLGNELLDLIVSGFIAAFGLAGIGLVYLFYNPTSFYSGVVVGAVVGLIIHELAHRESARGFGCYARYSIYPLGIVITLVSGLLRSLGFWFAFIMTGYVLTYCPFGGDRASGWISLWGPASNIVLSLIGFLASFFAPCCGLLFKGFGEMNAWLAFFNLLPFYPLDGSKVFRFNPVLWLLMIVVSGFLVFYVS